VAAEADPHWPQPHFGQTHSTVHLRTGTSFVTGYFTSLRTSWIEHRPAQPSWQPLLQVSQPPAHWLEPPQAAPLLQMGVTPGMQTSSQTQRYLYSVTFFVMQ
jgi:hypothetical protein